MKLSLIFLSFLILILGGVRTSYGQMVKKEELAALQKQITEKEKARENERLAEKESENAARMNGNTSLANQIKSNSEQNDYKHIQEMAPLQDNLNKKQMIRNKFDDEGMAGAEADAQSKSKNSSKAEIDKNNSTMDTFDKMSKQHLDVAESMKRQAEEQKQNSENGKQVAIGTGIACAGVVFGCCGVGSPACAYMCYPAVVGLGVSGLAYYMSQKSGEQSGFSMDQLNTGYDPNMFNKTSSNEYDLTPGGSPATGDMETDMKNALKNPNVSPKAKANAKNILKAIEAGKKIGVKIDAKNDKITMPDGKTYSISSLSTPSGMAAAGIGKNGFDKLQGIFKDAKEKTDKVIGAVDAAQVGGVGGGTKSASAKSGANQPGFNMNFNDHKNKNALADRGLASVSGLAKSDGSGGRIGVAGDEIFIMINRNFEKNTNKGFFIDPTLGF